VEAKKETLGFETEVKHLLHLMIHSLYSNKEIFLRELISNGSDAADRLRFEALASDGLYEGDSDLKIRVEFDKDKRTITVKDNGIGMDRNEVQEHIGTIAKSGTKQFFEALTGDQAKDSELIGQFGVGFYSSFIVADKVTLTTRKAAAKVNEGVRWESAGEGDYTLETVNKKDRGTEIVLHLKEGEDEFLDSYRLQSIIKKFSDHISLPVVMDKEIPAEKDEEGKETAPASIEEETVNSASALWTKARKDISDEEYNEFYKHVGHDFEDPLAYVHTKVEGKLEYSSLLYIPSRAPFDLWDRQQRHGIKLYVRRVFIMDDAEQLVPSYLRFIRGVVDSDDLPLNVSREILQRNKTIDSIRSGTTRKILDLLARMAKKEPEKYAKFWEAFGRVMKEGVIEETDRKEDLASLFRFSSTHEDKEEQTVSLADYVERMSEDQEVIYYVVADNFSTAKNSPHLEIFRKKGIEVLLLIDPIDEWLTTHLTEFGGKQLQSVTKGELNLGKLDEEKDKDSRKESNKESGELIEKIKKALESKVKDVRVTNRLTQSPACLVADEHDMGLNLERILKASGQAVPQSKPILEINIDHPVVKKLGEAVDEQFEDWSHILFDQALLSEGGELEDPAGFVHRLNNMFIALDSSEKVER
ncbi:MAG: molecular chaperone HtpG, partial [Gammaproteobacteria bacterium]|nr:molecular chaperone HtpG [Gammaproteobacteria bacterium]